MGVLNFVNHFGTFLLLVATILLIMASITAPTVDGLAFLTVDLGDNNGEITFGSFGYCVRTDNGWCSNSMIGYNPSQVVSRVDGADYSSARENTAEALTNVMVLHPVAAGFTFFGFIMSLGSGMFGSFLASIMAFTAFLVTLVVLICDWVWIALVRNNINDNDDGGNPDSRARYSAAIWCVLVAGIASLIASGILFITCCAGRRNRSRAQRQKVDYQSPPATASRRRWWSRNRY